MRPTLWLSGAVLLSGCTGGSLRCDKPIAVWADEDGDGYGGEQLADACELAGGQADQGLDCDDADPDVNPGIGEEVCDGRDDDCDGAIDNGLDVKQWYTDGDGDGFGVAYPSVLACEAPEGSWSQRVGDCDDADAARSPSAQEVCGGVDEDCDGFEGDFDDSVDPGTFTTFYVDDDRDGLGTDDETGRFCSLQAGYSPNMLDCDDEDDLVGQFRFYTDADDDSFGDPATLQLACSAPPNTVRNNFDCDDTDERWNIDKRWHLDEDLDGHGSDVPIAYQCTPPQPDAVEDDTDCDDSDPDIRPGVPDLCLDGVDQDCNGGDECRTCLEYLIADPDSASGVYQLRPNGNATFSVYCDMDTDEGGWTLVASSPYPLYDEAEYTYNPDIASLEPYYGYSGIWDGLREVMPGNSDIRFACKTVDTAPEMTVDLSFYDIQWYSELTAATYESAVCFNQQNGAGADPPPARRNNLTEEFLPEGDTWNADGYLEGEDSCSAYDDFTVDFDDRGVDGDPNDGTDWGYSNYDAKCGTSLNGGGYYYYYYSTDYFIFVREVL